ncbi:TPA: hypothetical protein ACHBXG_002801 [Klebsiella pneumoniae]
MNIETVNEIIASLESAGELSIREQKFLKLAKAKSWPAWRWPQWTASRWR